MHDYKFLVFVTAHNPLSRFDALLKTLRGYEEIPGIKDVFIYIDYEHREDEDTLKELIESNVQLVSCRTSVKLFCRVSIQRSEENGWLEFCRRPVGLL